MPDKRRRRISTLHSGSMQPTLAQGDRISGNGCKIVRLPGGGPLFGSGYSRSGSCWVASGCA